MSLTSMIRARQQADWSVRVVHRLALRYDTDTSSRVGAGWVRAGSALARFAKRLIIVQDDALWLGWWQESGKLCAHALPTVAGGPRLFDDKLRKPDFEAAVVLGQRLFVFGSGSLPSRQRIAVLDDSGAAQIIEASELYRALQNETRLAGRQLNIEGALLDGTRLVLYSRGNAAAFGHDGFDGSVELEAAELERYLDGAGCAPALGDLQQYWLGQIGSVRLTLTDVALRHGKRYYVAAAEASADAVSDGQVLGTALGVLDDDPRYALIQAEDGSPLCDKVEGLLAGATDDEWLAITDSDDASRPAELLTLRCT